MKLKIHDKDDGLREILASGKVTYLDSFVDVFDNHDQDQQLVKIKWIFQQVDNTTWTLDRYELDSTGVGMSDYTLANDFFRNRPKKDRGKSKGTGVYSLGEKTFNEIITASNKELKSKHGVEVITKQNGEETWKHVKYDASTSTEFINTRLTTEEVKNLDIPIDEIGTQGTWSRVYFDTSEWHTDWYDRIINEIEHYNSPRLKTGDVQATFVLRNQLVDDEYVLKNKLIPTNQGPTYVDELESGVMAYGDGKSQKLFDIKYAVRPSKKDNEDIFEMYEKQYGSDIRSRLGFIGKSSLEDVKLGDNLLVIFRDKHRNRDYTFRVLNSGQNTPRGIMIVMVDKDDDVRTTFDKTEAKLINAKGKVYADEDRKLREFWGKLVPKTTSTEPQLRIQLGKVLHLEEWPKSFGILQYNSLMDYLGVDSTKRFDKQWLLNNVGVETKVESSHKKSMDIFIKELNTIVELKPRVPNGDEDFNQIVAYSVVQPKTKKVITLGISDSKGTPMTHNSEYSDETKSTFEFNLNNDKTTKHIEWKLGDLRYFGLDVVHEDTIKPNINA